MAKLWDTKPLLAKDVGAKAAEEQQDRRLAFARKVLPWMLRMNFGRPVAPVNFSKRSGPLTIVRNFPRGTKNPIILNTEKDIDDWMGAKGRFVKCGGGCFTRGFMTLFTELNPSEPIMIGIFDIDIVDLSEKDVRPFAKKIYSSLSKKGPYTILILFTGNSYQLWFRRQDGEPLGIYTSVRDSILLPTAREVGLHIPRTVKRKIPGKISLDFAVSKKRNPIRFPFSQHGTTGLVALPMTVAGLSFFNPKVDAHPDTVEKNLSKYKERVEKFLMAPKVKVKEKPRKEPSLLAQVAEEAGISKAEVREFTPIFAEQILKGEKTFKSLNPKFAKFLKRYMKERGLLKKIKKPSEPKKPERKPKPPVSLRGKRPRRVEVKGHPDQKLADDWKNARANWQDMSLKEALKFYKGKKSIISVKSDGELTAIHYKRDGIEIPGGIYSDTKKPAEPTVCLMANHFASIRVDNPITDAFIKICEDRGLDEAIAYGELFSVKNGEQGDFPITRSLIFSANRKDWQAVRLWLFDLDSIDRKKFFPKVQYLKRLKALQELVGEEEV